MNILIRLIDALSSDRFHTWVLRIAYPVMAFYVVVGLVT